MLNRAIFNAIRSHYTKSFDTEAREKWAALPAAEQVAGLRAIVPADAASDEQIAAFVLVLRAKSGQVTAGAQDHFALRKELLPNSPAPKPWHKAKPPTTVWALTDPNRQPSWAEESVAHSAIAAHLTFDDARSGDNLAAAVRSHFGFGGMEDLMDYRAVGPSDPTMKLFIEGINHILFTLRPEWHNEDGEILAKLPEGVDARSALEIEEDRKEQQRKAHEEAARLRAAERRAKQLEEYAGLRNIVFSIIDNNSEDVVVAAANMAGKSFDEAKNNDITPAYQMCAAYPLIVAALAERAVVSDNATPEEASAILKDCQNRANEFLHQWVLSRLHVLQPGWLRELQNGDFKFRPAALKPKAPVITKRQKSAVRTLYKIASEYGDDVLLWAISQATSVALDKLTLAPRPEYLDAPVVVTDTEGEHVVDVAAIAEGTAP